MTLTYSMQTIFLNKKHKDTWSIDEIKEDKISKPFSSGIFHKNLTYFVIVRKDWWHQLEHSWSMC